MKKIGIILIVLSIILTLIMVGCDEKEKIETVTRNDNTQNKHNEQQEEQKEQNEIETVSDENEELKPMNEPKISVYETGNYYYITEENTILFLSAIDFEIKFENSVDSISAKNKINFSKPDIGIKKMKWIDSRTLYISIDEDTEGIKEFSLTIEEGILDTKNHRLMDDVVVHFKRVEPMEIDVRLISDNISYDQDDFYDITNTPKVFEVSFSNPIDRISLEEEFIHELEGRADVSFDWVDDTKLYITMENFDDGKYYFLYSISDFVFRPNKQSEIYCLDINTNEIKELDINFSKDIAWLYPHLTMEDKILDFEKGLAAWNEIYYETFIYNLETNEDIELKNEHSKEITYDELLNDNNYMIIDNRVYTPNGDFIKLINNENVIGYLDKVIRDEGKIIFYSSSDFDYWESKGQEGILLSIYDNEKEKVKNIQLDIQNLVHEQGHYKSSYVLLNDGKTIIIEGLELNEDAFNLNDKDLNLYKVDIESGQAELIFENAHNPIYLNDKEFMFVDEKGRVNIANANGDIIKELLFIRTDYLSQQEDIEDNLIQFSHIHSSKWIVVLKSEDSLYIYNPVLKEDKKIEIPKDLSVIGVSKDKVYLTNKRY